MLSQFYTHDSLQFQPQACGRRVSYRGAALGVKGGILLCGFQQSSCSFQMAGSTENPGLLRAFLEPRTAAFPSTSPAPRPAPPSREKV